MASFSWPTSTVSATSPSTGPTGVIAPTQATEVAGVTSGGILVPFRLDATGNYETLPLPTGAATAAKQDTGNTSVASIDTKTPALVSGRVPVDGSGVTQPISAVALPLPTGAATSALQTQISSQLPATLGQKVMAQSLPVTFASDQSPLSAYAVDQVASGTISALNANLVSGAATANSTVTLTGLQGMAAAVFQIPTAGVGTLLAQMSVDGANWVATTLQNVNTGALAGNASLAVTGIYQFECAGATAVRVTANAYTSGAPVITLRSCARTGLIGLDSPLPAGTNAIGNIATVTTVAAVTSITNPVTAAQSTAAAKTVKSAQVTVGTTAVRATTDGSAVTAGRVVLKVKPSIQNGGSIFIGPSTVTTSNGLLILPAETMELNFDAGEYYLISDTAAQACYVLEQE